MIRLLLILLLVAGISGFLLLRGGERDRSSPARPTASTQPGTVVVAEPEGPAIVPPSPRLISPPPAPRSFQDCLQAKNYQAASAFLDRPGASPQTLGVHGTQVIEDFVSNLRLEANTGASLEERRSASSWANVLEEIIEKSAEKADVIHLASRLRDEMDSGEYGAAIDCNSYLIARLLKKSDSETRKEAYREVGPALERYMRDPRHLNRMAPANLMASMNCEEAVKFFEERCSAQDPVWRECTGLRALDESGLAALMAWYFREDYDACMILGPFIASLGDEVRSSFRKKLLQVAERKDSRDYARLLHGVLGVAQNWSSHEDLRWMEDVARVFSADERSVLQMLDASLVNSDDLLALAASYEPEVRGSVVDRWCESVRERRQSR